MTATYWQRPVLRSVVPVIEQSRHVQTSVEAVGAVAAWMAYETFTFPSGMTAGPFDFGSDPDSIVDVILLLSCLNFAFTDYATSVKFEAEYQGRIWSDTEGMLARMHEHLAKDPALVHGDFLVSLTRGDLERIFHGTIELPMLDERVTILNEVGTTLVERYEGRFHRFVADCAPAMYADGNGLLERLVAEFPRFDDTSDYHGHEVKLFKLAQLCLWSLHMALHTSGVWRLRDLGDMTAFADYILPVALRLMGILEYAPDLERRINQGVMIEHDSDEEIEIRSHTLYATALLTDAINAIRPDDRRLVIPQVDFRLWKTYHATFWPHHLTETVMY
jgi:AcrR family transcriptional regulator